jgi:hypothetical protein
LWDDVRELISPGFLTHRVALDGVQICIRPPHPSDLFLAGAAYDSDSPEWVEDMVSRCIWMVDGINLLGERSVTPTVRAVVRDLPYPARASLFYAVLGLFFRSRKAHEAAFVYCYENDSRNLWRSLGKQWPVSDRITGVPGSESLGPNHVQIVWSTWNESEDHRLRDQYQWSLTKNMMGVHAPKGIKNVDASDKKEAERVEKDRQRALDMHFYVSEGVIDNAGKLVGGGTGELRGEVHTAHTAEELADEMRRWVAGEDDRHDAVVRHYKESVRQKMVDEAARRQMNLVRLRREAETRSEEYGGVPAPIIGYTLEQVRNLMSEKDTSVPAGARKIYDMDGKNRTYDKWIANEPGAGALKEESGGLEAKGDIPRPSTKKPDTRTINERIAARRPRTEDAD